MENKERMLKLLKSLLSCWAASLQSWTGQTTSQARPLFLYKQPVYLMPTMFWQVWAVKFPNCGRVKICQPVKFATSQPWLVIKSKVTTLLPELQCTAAENWDNSVFMLLMRLQTQSEFLSPFLLLQWYCQAAAQSLIKWSMRSRHRPLCTSQAF